MSDDKAITATQALDKNMGQRFISIAELPEEQKAVLKATVAKETTDTELAYFLNVAFSQDLDPFRKEVYCIKRAKKKADGTYDYANADLVIMTGRDGFLKLAKRDPKFDFIQSAEVREGDHFVMDPINGTIEHRFGSKRGTIIGAWAMITRKDGVKVTKYVTWQEYFDQFSSTWKDYPTAMIVKAAESILCKQFANITGIVAEETLHYSVDLSPAVQEQKQTTLKDQALSLIEGCTTPNDWELKVKPQFAVISGKLFGDEKNEVFAAAKEKSAALKTLPAAEPAKEETPPQPSVIVSAKLEEVSLNPDGTAEVGLSDVKYDQPAEGGKGLREMFTPKK